MEVIIFMEHVAIMKKSWGLTKKILAGQKRIESRWYKVKYPPWDKIESGDAIYFKDSGEPVKIKAEVGKVIRFSNLNPNKVKEILEKYGDEDGIERKDVPKFSKMFKDKNYCMLIFLKNPKEIEPFEIDKNGFGVMSSWIIVSNINKIKK